MQLTIDKSAFLELIKDGEEISCEATKHDCHVTYYVVPYQGKMWLTSAEFSYNDGIQDDEFYLDEAEAVEVKTTIWKVKQK